MSQEVKAISWKELTGNKFSKALHPAMFSETGYVAVQRIRRTGDPVPDIFKVSYDRQYAVEFIARKIIRPVSFLGKESMDKIIDDAWNLYEKNALLPHFVNDSID